MRFGEVVGCLMYVVGLGLMWAAVEGVVPAGAAGPMGLLVMLGGVVYMVLPGVERVRTYRAVLPTPVGPVLLPDAEEPCEACGDSGIVEAWECAFHPLTASQCPCGRLYRVYCECRRGRLLAEEDGAMAGALVR